MDYPQLSLRSGTGTRSMGVKLMVVCALAVIMTIPSLFVGGLVADRTNRAAEVVKEISSHVGGSQTFLGPTMAVPYSVPAASSTLPPSIGVYLISPVQASASVNTTTVERRRSLFRVPVFQAGLKLESTFDLRTVPAAAPRRAEFDWSRAEMVVGVTDARGAMSDATLEGDGGTRTLVPSELADRFSIASNENAHLKMVLLGTKLSGATKPSSSLHVTANLKFSGAERIAVLAYGKTTHVTARGDWRSPGFDGAILPMNRSVTDSGFKAEWSVPFIARGVRAEGPSDSITGLGATALGLSFIEVADAYQSVSRSLKYALLILGLVFLSYFVFEVTTGKRVHPAQYVLVGLAQIIFYLLLLSVAERIGFDLGFLAAASATVLLLSANAGWVFSSRIHAARALAVFGVLYVLIYLLLRLEDNALLVGAISSFLAIAVVMYLTRRLDWYGSIQTTGSGQQRIVPETSTRQI
jgi:inner membrane protein